MKKIIIIFVASFILSGCFNERNLESKSEKKRFSENVQIFNKNRNYLERYIDENNICYKTAGGALSCVVNKYSFDQNMPIDIEVFKSDNFEKYYDKNFYISCYITAGGKLSCVQK